MTLSFDTICSILDRTEFHNKKSSIGGFLVSYDCKSLNDLYVKISTPNTIIKIEMTYSKISLYTGVWRKITLDYVPIILYNHDDCEAKVHIESDLPQDELEEEILLLIMNYV
jgi:hypothetical protein